MHLRFHQEVMLAHESENPLFIDLKLFGISQISPDAPIAPKRGLRFYPSYLLQDWSIAHYSSL